MRHQALSLFLPALLLILASCTAGSNTEGTSPLAETTQNPDSMADTELLARGKKQFLRCSACHSLDPATPYMLGPHLKGIVGRQAASLEEFEYTVELSGLNLEWTETELDQWLREPQGQVKDMCMPFKGISDAGDRAALIAYLQQGNP